MVSKLLPLIPPHKIYCEPFSGGASLFFAKEPYRGINQSEYREILNDTSSELVNLYEMAQSKREAFLKRLREIPYSEKKYFYYKNIKKFDDPIEWAVSYYIRIMMSFAKKLDNGFAFDKCGKNSAKFYFNHLERLPEIIDRLKGIFIFNRDAINLIQKFDCPETFFYCDPPYPNTNQGHYKGYTQENFEQLIEVLKNCQGSFMLSCYDNVAPCDTWERHEFLTKTFASNTAKGGHREVRKEIVWRKLSHWAKNYEANQELFDM